MSSRAASDAALYSSARQEFLSLFPRRDQFIWKHTGPDAVWHKASGPLLDHQILGVLSDEGRGLYRGCYWSHKTRHAVLDVDIGSKYHNAAELAKLLEHLATIGLSAKVYQSSDTGGWHLYLFFDDWVESDQVNQSLKAWLKSLEYEINGGTLELFPSGNALRLPLQKGFAWLDSAGNLLRRREDLTESEALAAFLSDSTEHQSSWAQAKICIDTQLQSTKAAAGDVAIARVQALSLEGFEDLYGKGKIQEKWEKGREWWQRGLFESGQRHDAVLAVGHYLWYGDAANNVPAYPGKRHNGSRAQLIESWLAEKHNGFCRHVCEGRWEIVRDQIARAVVWRAAEQTKERPYYPVTDRLLKRLLEVYKKTGRLWDIDKMADANICRSQDARSRIARALRQCVDNGWQITRNGLAELSGCSKNTVSKHKDVWFLLASGSGVDLTRGGLGDPDTFESSPLLHDLANKEEEEFLEHSVQEPCGDETEESFLSSEPLADSRQAYGCWEWDLRQGVEENDVEASEAVCSLDGVVVRALPLPAVSGVSHVDLCLTPCAFEVVGDGERLTASEADEVLPPSASSSLAPEPSTDWEMLKNACGINGLRPTPCAGPHHLFLGALRPISGLGARQHRQVGKASARLRGERRVSGRRASFRKRPRTQQSRAPPGS